MIEKEPWKKIFPGISWSFHFDNSSQKPPLYSLGAAVFQIKNEPTSYGSRKGKTQKPL